MALELGNLLGAAANLTTAFAKDEQNLIDEKKTGDKVFVLTEADVKNTAYGFCDDAYISTSTRWATASAAP